MSLLESLILVSEKAANVARMCRQDRHLFQLLVQEKKEAEANPRFVRDFKTLADVLIQETVKHDIGKLFPEIRERIYGEENNTFCNMLGESISVEVRSGIRETSELLAMVLDGDQKAAELLAKEVHNEIKIENVNTQEITESINISLKDAAIWIDPIDSTAEYINGKTNGDANEISMSGLRCVTVLIGVYDVKTGIPLMGIVNQPFYVCTRDEWRGRCYWGISNSPQTSAVFRTGTICVSGSEDVDVKRKLEENGGFKLVEAAGAGYKILTTIVGLADAYVLSKNSTYKWDTCGPQALLKSFNGNIVVYNHALKNVYIPVEYTGSDDNCNRGGIIAYRDSAILQQVVNALQEN